MIRPSYRTTSYQCFVLLLLPGTPHQEQSRCISPPMHEAKYYHGRGWVMLVLMRTQVRTTMSTLAMDEPRGGFLVRLSGRTNATISNGGSRSPMDIRWRVWLGRIKAVRQYELQGRSGTQVEGDGNDSRTRKIWLCSTGGS